MNMKFIYFISFLLGLFLTLSFFRLNNNFFYVNKKYKIENFYSGATTDNTEQQTDNQNETGNEDQNETGNEDQNETANEIANETGNETEGGDQNGNETEDGVKKDIVKPPAFHKEIPKSDAKFMLLTTYNNKINNSEQKWYEEHKDMNKVLSTDFNENTYFIYNNPIEYFENKETTIIKAAVIDKTQFTGPNALYFANNYDINNFELSSFTLSFTLKIKNITTINTLFEMLANTSVKNKDAINYIPNSVSLIIKPLDSGNFDMDINIGNSKYTIKNIDKKVLIGVDIITITLIFDGINIKLILNNNKYQFKYNENEIITLGSTPVIINKDGTMDALLYSMVYYKTALTDEDLLQLKNFNNYYIYGLYQSDIKNIEKTKSLSDIQSDLDAKNAEIADLENRLNQCSNSKNLYSNTTPIELLTQDNFVPPYPSKY